MTEGVINGRGSNIVTDILPDSGKQLFETNTFQLHSLQSETLEMGPQEEYIKRTNIIIITPIDSRNISGNSISRIDTPGTNKDVWGVIYTTSNMLTDADNVEKFDTYVQSSTTQERNLESLLIEEESLKSIFSELGTKIDSSVPVNLAKSFLSESPNFKCIRHTPIETADIRNLECIITTRPKNCNGLRGSADRDHRLGYTHGF